MTGTLRNLHSPLFDSLFSHRVSVLRRDRLTVFIFPLEFLHSHSVSVQRRDRSLYLYYSVLPSSPFLPAFRFDAHTVYLSKDVTGHCCFHCTALPRSFFDLIAFFSLFLPVCVHTVYLSKDVTGRCSFHCTAFPRSSCDLIAFFPPFTFLSSHSVSVRRRDRSLSSYSTALPRSLFLPEFFWFVSSRLLCFSSGLLYFSHSVSVQRRDRSLFPPPLPLITQCICPKT